ncbi:Uma2 family endonuclease [Larkinella terrae]|uniref:Uma2 family endonuclease n=2 Tax=Larkinella terrae TaxID=2025311 RepID=A0A7K0EF83_9BACT|nr:Uma2 family endonuclease [Larkinella terrae]
MYFPLNIPPFISEDGHFTEDEFYEFCKANPELRIERAEDGQIYFQMPTGTNTSIKNADLVIEIGIWNRMAKLGKVTDSNGGFTLPDTSVRAPDVAWISNERWNSVPDADKHKFARICPDFVIELMSDRDERYSLPAKMEKYLQNGVRLAWLIDPFQQQTTVYRPDAEPQTKAFTEPLLGEAVLPGLEVNLSTLL